MQGSWPRADDISVSLRALTVNLFLILSLLLPAAALPEPAPESAAAPCREVCLRHVSAAQLRSRVCDRCAAAKPSEDRGAWTTELGRMRPFPGDAVRSSLQDPDWMVRFGAVRARALAQGARDTVTLANWVAFSRGPERNLAVLTAARVAASRHLPPQELLGSAGAQGERAAERVKSQLSYIRHELEAQVYSPDPSVSGEALLHLSALEEVTPQRAIFLAMQHRPPDSDITAATVMRRLARSQNQLVGNYLLGPARKEDRPLVQRLLAVYNKDLEPARLALTDPDPAKRRSAVEAMVPYFPLSRDDLEEAVLDPDDAVQLAAARALSRGEGQSLLALARAKLALRNPDAEEVQIAWLNVVAEAAEPGCATLLSGTGENREQRESVRSAAYENLPRCADPESVTRLHGGLQDAAAPIRASAVKALGRLLRSPAADGALDAAMEDRDPQVLLAALDSALVQGSSAHVRAINNLLLHGNAEVRRAAALALGRLGSQAQVKGLVGRLRMDEVPTVRVAAAQSLGDLGGPMAVTTLGAAATRDPDPTVRDAAGQSLRKLGFQR